MQTVGNHVMIDRTELQHLQDQFCKVTGVCIYSLDRDLCQVTEPSGEEEQLQKVRQFMSSGRFSNVLERVETGSLEEQAVEELESSDGEAERIAAISVCIEGKILLYWLVYSSHGEEQSRLEQILDLLRDASRGLLRSKISDLNAKAASQKSRSAQQQMSDTLRGIESFTEIVQLLDCENGAVEAVMEQWLEILSSYLKVDTAQLYRLSHDMEYMNVICEWRAQGMISIYDKTSDLAALDILKVGKPLILSADGSVNEYRQPMNELGLQAVMVFPVLCGSDEGDIVLSLNLREGTHVWSTSEVKFASDAVKVLRSILTRINQKKYLTVSREVLDAALDNVGCCVCVADKDTKEILFANRRLHNTFERELRDNSLMGLLDRGITGQRGKGFLELNLFEREHWYDLFYKEILWMGDRPAILYSLYDITDKKIYQRKLGQQTYTDFLTGLYNRISCERDLARQVDTARKNGTKGAVLYLDLDDFKHINDGLGHQYGDVLLKAISNSLQRVGEIESSCYRVGGDEFIIVISPDRYEFLDTILENIGKIFETPWFLKDADYYCTMSMGVVTFSGSENSVAEIIVKADTAMREAKKCGKNCIIYYNNNLDIVSGKRLHIEKNMRDAALGGCEEFELYYQPIINVLDGKAYCEGAEALIRWNSTNLGFLPPIEFIPLAEYLGLINPIGDYVLKEACKRCKEWNDNGYPNYRVNVNLSVIQLLQPDIVEIVEQTLEDVGISPQNLTLEVTESLAINDMGYMKEIMGRIKSLGVKIALDDFGTGYFSLNHIREIPFDLIKVDQSIVRNVEDDVYSSSFVKIVTELAENIGAEICVEGVETQAQYDMLKNVRIKYIQGYYFDQPMRREDFELKYCKI